VKSVESAVDVDFGNDAAETLSSYDDKTPIRCDFSSIVKIKMIRRKNKRIVLIISVNVPRNVADNRCILLIVVNDIFEYIRVLLV
jgi:hypothetical protein